MQTENGESVAVLNGGINIVVRGVDVPQLGDLGLATNVDVIDIETDRAVIWTHGLSLDFPGRSVQARDMPLEIYLEGNIIFRQGERLLLANRMYYDVRRNTGVILDGELITTLPQIDDDPYSGTVRLKAKLLEQLNAAEFVARNALVTTSRMEVPTYDVQASEVHFQDLQFPRVNNLTGEPVVDPATGVPELDHQQMVTATGTRVSILSVPVLYLPRFATNLQQPNFVVNDVRIRSDRVFGTQFLVDIDAYQALGIRRPLPGTQWEFDADYLSDRGLAGGTRFDYERLAIPHFEGAATGNIEAWFVDDSGRDNLGRGRQNLVPEESFRGQILGDHRHTFSNGWKLDGQIGYLSDRTFREQFYEAEWDQGSYRYTGVALEKTEGLHTIRVGANGRVNNFFAETQWLPRLDYYRLGQPILGGQLTWSSHTSVGYANSKVASTPTNPVLAAQFKRLPFEENVNGERLVTRHEFDYPVRLGAMRLVPFGLGEIGHWGETLDGNEMQRAYVQTGVRSSLPMWAVYPQVVSSLFNLNGLAHKVSFDTELAYADANQNYDEFPLYDPLDDPAIVEFRRRLFFNTFGGTLPGQVPLRFDSRTVAIRNGLQGNVTAPAMEVVDDLQTVRLAVRQRWQTRRGPPRNTHIVDWLSLDMGTTWFPEASRDNFGADFGLAYYDMRWHLGDRFTVLSDGQADFFGSGLRTFAAGVLLNRPLTGNAYLGFRSLNGPIDAQVVTGSYVYRMTPKWVSSASASVDLADTGNIGQSLSLTRVGESLLLTMGVTVDSAKNNVGVKFLIEPRLLRNAQITRRTGLVLPPTGAFGIE